jgi:iron complex outermembrane recepter protein
MYGVYIRLGGKMNVMEHKSSLIARKRPSAWQLLQSGPFGIRALIPLWAILAAVPLQAAPVAPLPESESAASAEDSALDSESEQFADMDLDQLASVDVVVPSLDMTVSTVERQESTVGRTPAAVFVITNDMIRRSGARSIPDVLRLAPGVQVLQQNADEWGISIRGFNDVYSDKLLVQIDGRSVYNSLFGGVYWDVQDLVLEDIERIEVIRGPGATVWGANAVNGVINIITKSSYDTQGGYFLGGAGTEQRGFSTARYGGQLGDNATYRIYGKWFERDTGLGERRPAADDARQARGGFRIDWTPRSSDTVTLQGEYYNGYSGEERREASPSPPFRQEHLQDVHVSGGNVLGRWTRILDEESDWSFQWYYDRAQRHDTVMQTMLDYDVIDLDFQYRFALGDCHSVICGGGYRNHSDFIRTDYNLEFDPSKRATDLFSYFVQDQITLREDLLYFTLGSKFEHNDYTGFEIQPTARLLWTPDKKHSLWGSVSRAVQTPNRLTHDGLVRSRPDMVSVPPFGVIPVFEEASGNRQVESAEVIAYEAGMRAQPVDWFYWDLAIFYNDYDKLLGGIQAGPPYLGFTPTGYLAGFVPIDAVSNVPGESYGFELAAGLDVSEQWKLRGAYSFLRIFTHPPPGVGEHLDPHAPRNMFYLWLSGDLCEHWSLDVIGRYMDDLIDWNVPDYLVADVRLAYRPRPDLEWSVVGRNLLEGVHSEGGYSSNTGVQQEVYGAVTCRF